MASGGRAIRTDGTAAGAGEFWPVSTVLLAAFLGLGVVATPFFYLLVARLSTPGPFAPHRALDLHILANCAVNTLVAILAWGLRGRLDRRLIGLLNLILALHGLLAMTLLLMHGYYSIRVMIPSVGVSAVLGLASMGLKARLAPQRVALIGPWHEAAGLVAARIDPIDDPAAKLHGYDLVLTSFTGSVPPEWAGAISRALLTRKPVRHVAEYLEEVRGRVSIEHFDLEHVSEGGLVSYQGGKRVLDLVLLAAILPFALPVLLVAMVVVMAAMGRPVFFVQPRVGFGGKVFRMIKLRSMRASRAGDGEAATALSDDRVTGLGRFMRRFRIDEIPQLWNVAVGEMSFIGPRPEQPGLTDAYAAQVPAFAYRQLVKPGISGWAQVRAGYAANLEETRTKLGYDLYYLKYFSLGLDLQIILRTAWTLVAGGGAR
jgi:lipopolysaccharide/colanic/teichoic acid biosynthesis glycosyltransferase